jgi:tyrosinase
LSVHPDNSNPPTCRYWDWTLDSAQPEHSPIWSPQIGFGGNGDASSHCVQDGYFLDISPQYPSQHCLRRNFTAGMNGFNYTADIISELIQNANTYEEFRSRLESGPHKSVHNGIGGEMPTDASPNGICQLSTISRMG